MYQFTSSSMLILERCIDLAKQRNETNQWNQKFSLKSSYSNEFINNLDAKEGAQLKELNYAHEEIILDPSINNEQKYKDILTDPIAYIDVILEEGSLDNILLIFLSENLTDMDVERLSGHILEDRVNLRFIENFFTYFLPNCFKRENSRLSLDLLIRAFKSYPAKFHLLLQRTLDTEMDCHIFQEFTSILTPQELSAIMKSFIEFDLSVDVLIRHMFAFVSCYKSCIKDVKINNFVVVKLNEAAEKCTADKQYGRLLLTYLQNKNDNFKLSLLKRIVDNHRSPFKRPCLNMLNELVKRNE
ncbi:unnamed protein product [Leptosia nina]|uniref:Uncharacterized protein n=1 Tax=Leptosia nina TaxID=320188 RepID=A0AAV1JF06_9NEOP